MESEVAAIEASMAEARRARARGQLEAAEEHLAAAWGASTTLPAEHSIRAIAGWRHLKALFDLERVEEGEEVLLALLELPDPFVAEGGGLRAAEPVARGIWDRLGYGRPSVARLWDRYVATWEQAGDPWMAASGATQRLWDWACSGHLERVHEALEAIACTTPRSFAGGASRHPLAADASESLWFAQMDQARIASWAAVWARDEGLARVALELYADALAEAEQPEDYWFVEASARAELAFDWRREWAPRWEAAADGLAHERVALHQAMARLGLHGDGEALAGQLQDADAAGPEWGVDARRQLLSVWADDPRAAAWAREADERIDRFGLGVFRAAGGGAVG